MCVNNATIIPGVGISYQTANTSLSNMVVEGWWFGFCLSTLPPFYELLFLSIYSIVRCENICSTGKVLLKLGLVPGQWSQQQIHNRMDLNVLQWLSSGFDSVIVTVYQTSAVSSNLTELKQCCTEQPQFLSSYMRDWWSHKENNYVKLLLLCFYKTPNHDVYFDFYMVYLDTTESCEHLL